MTEEERDDERDWAYLGERLGLSPENLARAKAKWPWMLTALRTSNEAHLSRVDPVGEAVRLAAERGKADSVTEPFGFEIKRPGESLFPEDWALILPHQCGEWVIEECDLDTVIASAKRFRAELDAAISELESERTGGGESGHG